MTRLRGPAGWALFIATTWLVGRMLYVAGRLPWWVAGPGEIERRLADRSWLEYSPYADQRPLDFSRRPW